VVDVQGARVSTKLCNRGEGTSRPSMPQLSGQQAVFDPTVLLSVLQQLVGSYQVNRQCSTLQCSSRFDSNLSAAIRSACSGYLLDGGGGGGDGDGKRKTVDENVDGSVRGRLMRTWMGVYPGRTVVNENHDYNTRQHCKHAENSACVSGRERTHTNTANMQCTLQVSQRGRERCKWSRKNRREANM
jgi:hypothetical protein